MKTIGKFIIIPIEEWEHITKMKLPKKKEIQTVTSPSPMMNIQSQEMNPQPPVIPVHTIPLQDQMKKVSPLLTPPSIAKKKNKKWSKTNVTQNGSTKKLKMSNEQSGGNSEISNVKTLLKALKKKTAINWNKKGELIVKGKIIKGSNINELIMHSNSKSNYTTPKGYKIFYQVLGRNNVPQRLINSREGKRIMSQYNTTWRPPGILDKPKLKK